MTDLEKSEERPMPITFNAENFRRVLDHIKKHPETWDQTRYHCGSAHCFAGHAQIMAGKPADTGTVRRDARMFLGLTQEEADWLFDSDRTLEDFEAAAVDGYDRYGYNRDGYDRAGYNRDGYDRAGLDRNNMPRGGSHRD